MDLDQAERRFRDLQKQYQAGRLDADQFRVEVAKLLFRDEHGTFWLPDPDGGGWFCNRGEGWGAGDPHQEQPFPTLQLQAPQAKRRRRRAWVPLLAAILILLVGAGLLWQGWGRRGSLITTDPPAIQVLIASPADGSQVAAGQVVAIEASLKTERSLQAVDHVEFRVDGVLIGTQAVPPKIAPGQTSLPLSQQWRPTAIGEHQVTVTANATGGGALGSAAITLNVAQASAETLLEPECTADATFVADVTIPPGTAFPPGARLDKVWQVRNSGSCAWGMGYELVLVEGDNLGAPGAVPVPPTAAGELADVALTFWAPAEVGAYDNRWRLQAPDGQFFGPELLLSVNVQALAHESSLPETPANLRAVVVERGNAVRLTWEDRSDNEDAFRVYREDVEASIGLAPANTTQFVDETVACGHTYRYALVAFNAAGASSLSPTAEVNLAACTPPDAPPTLILTVVPTQVVASGTFTVVFQAEDDTAVAQVTIRGQATGDPALDEGRVFPCVEMPCAGSWAVAWQPVPPATGTLTTTLEIVAVARDASGQASEPARVTVSIRPPQ